MLHNIHSHVIKLPLTCHLLHDACGQGPAASNPAEHTMQLVTASHRHWWVPACLKHHMARPVNGLYIVFDLWSAWPGAAAVRLPIWVSPLLTNMPACCKGTIPSAAAILHARLQDRGVDHPVAAQEAGPRTAGAPTRTTIVDVNGPPATPWAATLRPAAARWRGQAGTPRKRAAAAAVVERGAARRARSRAARRKQSCLDALVVGVALLDLIAVCCQVAADEQQLQVQ